MGQTVSFHCTNCSTCGTATVGAGMADFRFNQPFPVYCENCAAVRQANMLAKTPACRTCNSEEVISYMDPSLRRRLGEQRGTARDTRVERRTVARCFDLSLTDDEYFCPSCAKFGLRFVADGILFD